MSNIIYIQPCKFIDCIDSKNVTSYGYRCHDDYGSCYSNSWERKHINMPPIEIFRKAYKERGNDPDLDLMLEHAEDCECMEEGIWIGDTKLEWEQMKDIITEHTL